MLYLLLILYALGAGVTGLFTYITSFGEIKSCKLAGVMVIWPIFTVYIAAMIFLDRE